MKLGQIIPYIKSYYEVVDLKRNLLYTREYYVTDYDNCIVKEIRKGEGFDGSPCIKIIIERGCYGA